MVQHEKRIVWRKTVGEKDRNLADLLRGGANDENLLRGGANDEKLLIF